MFAPVRLFRVGVILLLLALLRLFLPFVHPAEGHEQDLWFQIYSYSLMLWVAAAAVLVAALIAKLRL